MIHLRMKRFGTYRKPFGIIILSLLFCLFLSIFQAEADNATELRVPSIKGKSGQSIVVPLIIDRIENLAGVKVVMKYDPDILMFKKGEKTRQTTSLMHIINDKKPGLLIMVMAGAKGIQGRDVSILLLTFEIKKNRKADPSDWLRITELQLMSDQLKDIKCSTKIGELTILAQ